MNISLICGIVGLMILILCLNIYLFKNRNIGPNNGEYYNEDGDHIYYDRKLIRSKQQQNSNTNN